METDDAAFFGFTQEKITINKHSCIFAFCKLQCNCMALFILHVSSSCTLCWCVRKLRTTHLSRSNYRTIFLAQMCPELVILKTAPNCTSI